MIVQVLQEEHGIQVFTELNELYAHRTLLVLAMELADLLDELDNLWFDAGLRSRALPKPVSKDDQGKQPFSRITPLEDLGVFLK